MKSRRPLFLLISLVAMCCAGSVAIAGSPLNYCGRQMGPGLNYTIAEDAPYIKRVGCAPWTLSAGGAPYKRECGAAPFTGSKGCAAYLKGACDAHTIVSNGQAPYKTSAGMAPVSVRLRDIPCRQRLDQVSK